MDFMKLCRNQWERAVAILTVTVALVVFLLGWLGLSDKSLVTEQVPYVVSGALFGLFLLAVGATMWLSADLHDEWVKLDRLEEAVVRAGLSVREPDSGWLIEVTSAAAAAAAAAPQRASASARKSQAPAPAPRRRAVTAAAEKAIG